MRLRARIADLRGRGIYQGYPDRYRCIFIHVPKTAGSSIANVLFGSESGHVRYSDYQRANPKKFESYFKFCFVRNPWDRLVSSFFFLRAGGMNDLDRAWAAENLAGCADFEDFVSNWLDPARAMSFPHFRPQSWYVADGEDRVRMDFVGRFETLARDFATVAARLGREGRLPVFNKSSHAHYSTYYTPATRARVGRIYSLDASQLGYTFDG
jgi:hypothetical protein